MKVKDFLKEKVNEISDNIKDNVRKRRELSKVRKEAEHKARLKAEKEFAGKKVNQEYNHKLKNLREGKKRDGFFGSVGNYMEGLAKNFQEKDIIGGGLKIGKHPKK